MPPVRIKVYGLVNLTRQTYLRIQGFGLVVLLSLIAVGGALMVLDHTWRPQFPPKDVHAAMIWFFWISLVTLLLEVVETSLVLRKFAEAEAKQRAAEAAVPASPNPAVTVPRDGIQAPSAVQPTPPLENHPHP